MDINPKVWNIQDTIHRLHEAQAGRPKCGCLGSCKKGEQTTHRSKYGDNHGAETKQRPYRDCLFWGFIPYTVTKPRQMSRSACWQEHDISVS